jgi:DinB superfamily
MKNVNYEQITESQSPSLGAMLNQRSEALATRLENGATALAAFAATLSEAEWQTHLPKDGRKVGVVVHHVASMYPIEIQLASLLAAGQPITGVTWDAVDTINRDHAKEYDNVAKEAALALLRTNSAAAAAAIRAFTDEELDRAASVSLNSDAPLTCQFFLEDHAVRHSYHHLSRIKAAVAR